MGYSVEHGAEALILMGAWCGAYTTDTMRKKTGMRLRPVVPENSFHI